MKILCATDLVPKSESAIDRAGMLSDLLNADLSLLHVVMPPESARMLEEDLEHTKLLLTRRTESPVWRYGTQPRVLVRAGSPPRILLQTLRKLTPDLLVLGRQRRSRIRAYFARTLATRVLTEGICPVLIVNRMPLQNYRRIVLALDGGQASARVVRAAEAMILTEGVQASIVHACLVPEQEIVTPRAMVPRPAPVIPLPGDWSREAAVFSLRTLLSNASRDISRYAIEVENSSPLEAIQNVVGRQDADLLILGTRGHGKVRRVLLGSVAHRALAGIDCDILVVPDRSRLATEHNPSPCIESSGRLLGKAPGVFALRDRSASARRREKIVRSCKWS